MTTKKLNDLWLKNLYSTNEQEVLMSIERISESGNSEYLPALIDLLNTHKSTEVTKNIIQLLSSVKHTNAVPLLIKAIEDNKLLKIREHLVRSCWENGLDYSNYLYTFIDLLIHGDYMVAFEAYTVIESCEGNISKTSMHQYLDLLRDALASAGEERQTLIHHIIHFLPSLLKT
ncbi:MAG: HEAT repeat domain-containing protein [Prolixibacteraceae bacterium]|nr:HEAT repeat domain-containing protein [Prolixibacteraceae bacterium]